ncbi:hypothetical protein EsHS_00001006 [Epichloe bromicola]
MAAQRDYYADLELPRDADINDIKKQFRKLALKYHPDRNPGREQEVNAKFQIIQAANEVLSDPNEKSRYDAILGRSRYPGASGVKGNPWANAGAQFPTPPRRTNAGANAARNTQNSKNAQSGAQRWQTRFSSGVPPTAKQTFGSDHEAKRNAAKAFENMRKNAQKEPRPTEPPPPPPRQPPRTEYARQRAEASFGSKKSGYYPRSTMPGDEPPVSSQNYSSSERRDVPPPPPQRPGPNPMADPLSRFREKNNSSASTRPGQDPNSGQQPQSANANGDAASYARSPFKSRPDARSNAERANPDPVQTSTSDFGTENKSSNNVNGPSMYGNPYSQACSASQNSLTPKSTPPNTGTKHPSPTIELESSRTINADIPPSGTNCDSVTSISFERKQTSILNELINFKDESLCPNRKISWGVSMNPHENKLQHEKLTNQRRNNSFSFPVDDDTFRETGTTSGGNGFAKSSVDDINTSFANDEGSNTWQFNAGTGEADANVGNWPSPGSRRTRRSHIKRPAMRRNDSTNTTSNASQAESGFNAEGWSDKFGPQTFVPQPAPGPSVSPTRTGRANSRRSKAKPTAGTAASVEESSSEEETYDWRGRSAQAQARPVATGSPQAMDIDTPSSEGLKAQFARNIHVEPSRPEWRAGNVDGASSEEMPQRPAKIPLDANAAGSEDSEEFRASFADLKNVAPFAQQKEGLGSFSSLKDNLPFESKASDFPPGRLSNPQPLEFPEPPVAPRLHPTVAIEGMKRNTASWNKYLADFEDYLRQWDSFNGQVVDHFATRKTLISGTREAKGYGFLGARGDTEIQEYFNWVQQDNDVRRRWRIAQASDTSKWMYICLAREQMMSMQILINSKIR